MEWNEWGNLCVHIGKENLLRMVRWMRWHRIRNSSPSGLMPSMLPLVTVAPHNIESLRVSGEETFCFFETWRPEWGSNPRSRTFQAGSFNPFTAKLFNLNFHPLEVVSCWRDSQLQVSENYSELTKWRSTLFKSCWLMSHFICNMFKRWYLMC